MKRNFDVKTLDEFQAFIIWDVWAQYDSEFLTSGYGYLFRVYNNVLKSRGDNIRIEVHAQSREQSVKAKSATGVDECMLNMAEYEGLMEEVLTFSRKYKPPSHGYRPTLPLGYHFGKELLPRGQNCDSGDEDMDG